MKLIREKLISENPFYDKKGLLAMFNLLPKQFDAKILNNAWEECKTIEDKELFFSLFFAVGDITNRQHNVYRRMYGKEFEADNGGHASRKIFINCLNWLVENQPRTFYKLLPLISEYTNIENLFYYKLKTDRFKGKVLEVNKINVDINKIAEYAGNLIKSEKMSAKEELLWIKMLTRPAASRQKKDKSGKVIGRRNLKPEAAERSTFMKELLTAISKVVGWEIVQYEKNIRFVGWEKWKKKYDDDIMNLMESKMFASKKIVTLDKVQFFKWLDQQPAGANYRIQRRLMDKDGKDKGKWKSNYGFSFADAFKEWEKYKAEKQKEVRILEDKVKTGVATEAEKNKLEKVKKEAKVNTGATDLFESINNMLSGKLTLNNLNLLAHSVLEKVKFNVPVLVISDQSGSMGMGSGLPIKVARLLTTVALIKNPEPELGNMFICFGTSAKLIAGKNTGINKKNRFVTGTQNYVDRLIDPSKTFYENYQNVSSLINSTEGDTRINTVIDVFKNWVNEIPSESSERTEIISQYPLFLVISDGAFNNSYFAGQSLRKFQQDMLQYFGWNGVVVVWDVSHAETKDSAKATKFEGLENVVHYSGYNAGIINTIFSNLHDIDIIDIYVPLLSIHRSNRYQPVREYVNSIFKTKKVLATTED